jgi:uroporphyrin-III C-methyltransferase
MPSKWDFQPAADQGLSESQRARSSKREAGLGTLILSAASMAVTRTGLALWHRYTVKGREHLPAQTPAAVVQAASQPDEARLLTTLDRLAAEARHAGLGSPGVILIGAALAEAEVPALRPSLLLAEACG